LRDIGDIRFEDVERPQIDQGEVLVRVRAAGICGSDVPRIYCDGAHNMPLIPGHEFSGEVVGTGVADDCWLGKRVGVFPLIPCKKCIPCMNRQYEMCKNYSYLGSRRDGAFAEYVSVPVWNLIELPDKVSFEQAAMLEPMAVAVHALRRCMDSAAIAKAKNKNSTVLVYGLGTIGLMLTMFLLEIGIEDVLVIGKKNLQKETALSLGVKEENYCDSKSSLVREWIDEKTGGNEVDFCFECVGDNNVVSEAIDLAAPLGKVMLVGNPHSDMTLKKNTYWKILRNQLTVLGTWNSSFTHDVDDDWHYVLDRLKCGSIQPELFITHRYQLCDMESGSRVMRDKIRDYIKEMVVC